MKIQLEAMQLLQTETVSAALEKINENALKTVFIIDDTKRVVGVVTDGDIRRNLLEGLSLDGSVKDCMNANFVWASAASSRESLLKRLDNHISILPVCDASGRLVDVVTKESGFGIDEGPLYIRSRAPVRVSFGGGGSDLTHYFSDLGIGAVINTTISLYSHATLKLRADTKAKIYSADLRDELTIEDVTKLDDTSGPFGLIKALLQVIRPQQGFELSLHSDFPMKSGLGGSASMSAATLGCFNELRRDQFTRYELAELAYKAERHVLGINGGWQDQYATVFGGFNFMEFRMDENIIHPLRVHPDVLLELEASLVLCDTGLSHDSGSIHDDQKKQMQSSEIQKLLNENVSLSYEMRNQLLRGSLKAFGESLHKSWLKKRQFSTLVSNTHLDGIYEGAIKAGAIGGKLLGAGNGGFFLFYLPHDRKRQFTDYLEEAGLRARQFNFERNGLQSWSVRDDSLL